MSKQIDERVVEMTFDNSDFERNVKQSMSTIDRLKSALNFKGTSKGLEEVNRQAKAVDFKQMGSAIDQVRVKFSALQVAGVTALANITNSIVTAGRNMVNQFTLAPVISGFQEYETQLNSVQTIMANTASKGTTIDQVTDALNELNTYADKTIYNFTEMTRNIGTFTAAGVDLETSVSAIQGIANLAAMSGSTSVQASTAMYQLSQALAAGRVSLMDWNSVVNAGMGGEQFQTALKRTAEAMGTNVDAIIEKYGSFRESLTQGQWLTTEVLTETLKQISGAYSEADLIANGYTEDQAREIVEMARTAEDAATKVKTFTQMIDTLQEAVGSGWAQTWQTIFGDFYEAREFWTDISNMLGDMVNASSEARNEVLDGAFNSSWSSIQSKIKDTGADINIFYDKIREVFGETGQDYDALIERAGSLDNAIQDGAISADIVSEAFRRFSDNVGDVNDSLPEMESAFGSFRDTVKDIWRYGFDDSEDKMQQLSEAGYEYAEVSDLINKVLNDETVNVAELSDEQLRAIGVTEEQLTSLGDLRTQLDDSSSSFRALFDTLTKTSGRVLFLESIENILRAVTKPLQSFTGAWHDIFSIDSSQVYGILEGFNHFTESLIISDETSGKLQRTFKGLFSILSIFTTFAGGAFSAVFKVVQGVLDNFNIGILDVTAGIGDAITAFAEFVNQNNIVNVALDFLADRITDVIKWVSTFAQKVRELGIVEFAISKISSAFEVARIIGKNLFNGLQPYIQQFIDLISNIQNMSFEEFLTQLKDIFDRVVEFASGKISSILTVLGSTFSDVFGKIADALGWIPPLAQDAGGSLLDMVKNVYNRIKSVGGGGLVALIFGIGAIATFKVITGLINKITSPIQTLSETISGIGEAIDNYIDAKAFRVKSEAIRNIAISIAILAGAVFLLAQLEPDRLVSAAVAVGGLAIALGVMTALMGVAGKLGIDKFADSILKLSASVLLVAASLKVMEGIDSDTIVPNIVAIIAVIGVLAGLALALDHFGSKGKVEDFGGPALQILALAAAVRIVADAFVALNAINPDNLLPTIISLISVVGAMGILAFAMDRLKIGGGGVGLLAMVIGLRAFLFVLEGIAGMDTSTILEALPNFITIVGLIAALMFATSLAGSNAVKAGGSIILMSAGIFILVQAIKQLAGMSAADIKKGTDAITQIGIIFAALVAVTKLAGDNAVKAGASLILMSLAMLILTGVIALISMMDPAGLAQGLAAITVLGLIFSVLIGVTHFAKGVHKEIIAMAAVVGVLVAAVAVLSLMDPAAMEKSVEALTLLMGAFSLMMGASRYATGAYGAMFAMVGVVALLATILGAMSALDVEASIENADAIGVLLTALSGAFLLSSFAKGDPKDLAKTSLAMLAMVPAMAAIGLVLAEIQALGVDAQLNNVVSLALLLGELAGITVILDKFNVSPVAAAKGAAAIDAVTVIIGGLIALIGWINDATDGGLASSVQEAIPVMQGVGQAIGELIGGLVGGLVSGAGQAIMSMLPALGSSLSQFWLNIQPFILGTKMMGDDALGGIKTLVEALMMITGADFVDNLNEFIQGESTMVGFTKSLTGLAHGLVEFSDILSEGKFDGEIVSKAATAGKLLGEMQSLIQGNGGLANLFTGEKDMADFGEQLSAFGEGIVEFSNTLVENGGIDEGAITAASNAGKIMAELQGAISGEGDSVLNWIMGEKNLGSFGEQLKAYGNALVEFSDTVSGDNAINMDAVTSAKNAGDIMASLQESLKDTGDGFSLSKLFEGEKNLENFGNQMKAFGEAMVTFSGIIVGTEDVPGIDATAIENAAALGTLMSELANNLPTYTFGSGKLDLTGFGQDLTSYARSISNMSDILSSVDLTKVEQAATISQVVSDVVISLQGTDESVINKFWILGSISDSLSTFSEELATVDLERVGAAIVAANKVKELIIGLSGITGESVGGFVSAVQSLAQVSFDQISSAFDTVDFSLIGVKVMTRLSMGFEVGNQNVVAKLQIIMRDALSTVTDYGADYNLEGVRLATELATGIQNGAQNVQAQVSIMVQNAANALNGYEGFFYAAGSNLAVGFANGISASAYRATLSARAMAKAAKEAAESALGIQSPSKVLKRIGEYAGEGFAIGIENYVGVSEKVGADLASGVIAGASKVADVLDRSGTMEAIAASFRELSDALTETDEETSSASEESEEKTSKLADALSSMADSVDEVTSRKKDLKAFDRILNRTGVTFTNAFVDEMINSTGQFAGAISEMADLTDEQLQQMVDAFTETKLLEQINELTDFVNGDDGFIDALAEAGINILDFAKDADKLGYTLDDINSKIDDFASNISDGFSKMDIEDQTGVSEFISNLRNNMEVAEDFAGNVENVFGKLSIYPEEWTEEFRKAVMEGGFSEYGKIMDEMSSMSADAIMELVRTFNTANIWGDKISQGLYTSFVDGDYKTLGKNVAEGISSGISSNTEGVNNAASLMATGIEDTVKNKLEIHSPSAVMVRLGQNVVAGLAQGLKDYDNFLKESAVLLSNTVIAIIQQTLDNHDFTITVSISPVIDTTNLEAKLKEAQVKVGTIAGGMLTNTVLDQIDSVTSSVGQNGVGNSSKMIASAVDRLGSKIDSIDPSNFGVTYQQNNYSPKALSTATIYRQTRNHISLMRDRKK